MANFQVDPKRFPLIKERVRKIFRDNPTYTFDLPMLTLRNDCLKFVDTLDNFCNSHDLFAEHCHVIGNVRRNWTSISSLL